MQEYLWKNAFREKADALGFHFLALILCCGWFLLLWGVRVQSLTAGLCAFGLVVLLRHKTRDDRLARREQKLRCRLGGQMHLEKMLLLPAQRAHFEMALHLCRQENLCLARMAKDGVICRQESSTLLLSFLQLPLSETLKPRDVLSLQQAACREQVQAVWLCTPCQVTDAAHAQGENTPPVRFFEKEQLISLFGHACPATDQQLVEMGRLRRKKLSRRRILQAVFQPRKVRRYALYGAMLLLLYTLTGLAYYAVPGVICVLLAAASRCMKH